jgi:hypothetical protein
VDCSILVFGYFEQIWSKFLRSNSMKPLGLPEWGSFSITNMNISRGKKESPASRVMKPIQPFPMPILRIPIEPEPP